MNLLKRHALTLLSGVIGNYQTARFTERTMRIFSDADQLQNLSIKWQNVARDKAQGHLFEQLEVMKFNHAALEKDSALYAQTTASMGLPTAPADILIKRGNKTIREIQAKSCNTASRSAYALSNSKYKEMLRLSPSEQHEKIEELLKKRIAAGTLKAKDYEQTLRNLKKSLAHGDVSSSGTTYREAFNATTSKIALKIANKSKFGAALVDMHRSGNQAAKTGALMSGGMNVLAETKGLVNGEKELAEVAVNTAIASAKGYATGYTVTALSKGVVHSANHFLGKSVAQSLTRSNAHVAIAAGVVNSSKSMISYLRGDIDFTELSNQISHTAITSSSSFYYGAVGQALIPIPVVGALVGSSVGYLIGNLIHQSGLLALGDSVAVQASKERRQQIEQMCLQAIPQIQQHRKELESQFSQQSELRKQGIDFGFLSIQSALENSEPEKFIQGLNSIGKQFGVVLPYENFNEFDKMMKSNDRLVF